MQQVEIRIKGHIDPDWSVWFEGFAIDTSDDGVTVLSGQVVDQSALYGALAKLRDLGLSLLSVRQVDVDG